MKILKNLVIALVLIFLLAGVVIYFLPNSYSATNMIEIDRPVSLVYEQVADFNKWGAWSPWKESEPTAKVILAGQAGVEGQKMSWEGDKVGEGSMTLVATDPNEALVCTDVLVKPIHITMKDYWRFEGDGQKTRVFWTTQFGLMFPKGRLFGLMADKFVCQTEKHGLENLKKVCEAMPMPVDTAKAQISLEQPPALDAGPAK